MIDLRTKQALRQLGDSFVQFSRNGRWGACGKCPRDVHGHVYPEHCDHAGRFDHSKTAKELAEEFEKHRGAM